MPLTAKETVGRDTTNFSRIYVVTKARRVLAERENAQRKMDVCSELRSSCIGNWETCHGER
jgi:hypothetical protein